MPEGSARASDEHDRAEHHRAERADSPAEHSAGDQGEFVASRSAPTYPGKLLGDPRLRGRGNAPAQADLLRQMQQTYGNRATQRLLQRQRASHSVIPQPTTGAGTLAPAAPIQREVTLEEAPAPSPPTAARASEWIVDDSVENPLPGQMTKSAFIAQVRGAVKAAVGQTMSGDAGASQAGPQIDNILRAYSLRDSRSLEQEIRKSIPGAASATSASSYIHLIAGQVRRSVAQQASAPGTGGLLSSVMQAAGNLVGGIGKLLFKARGSGAKEDVDPAAINSQLGPGQPLDGAVGGGMESAFGQSFSGVRVHTDTEAAGHADNLNARAFTVGQNIAFGTGEYRPGTPVGDALIAHELAHVVQQGGASAGGIHAKAGGETSALEEDADSAAVRAVVGMRGGPLSGLLGGMARISSEAMPRLRSGLRLQRCGKSAGVVGVEIDRVADLIGYPDENADEIVEILGSSSRSEVARQIMSHEILIKEDYHRALAGTAGGRRILAAMSTALNGGDGSAKALALQIDKILGEFQAEQENPREPSKPVYKQELDRIAGVLTGGGEYASDMVDYVSGRRVRIVPLQFPITLLPGIPQMGGLYYDPNFSRTGGTNAGVTKSRGVVHNDSHSMPLVYIVIGPQALYQQGEGPIEGRPPTSDALIESTLFHEFQHYKQDFAKRGQDATPVGGRPTDEDPIAELEATGFQIARYADSDVSDGELEGMLNYLDKFMKESKALIGSESTEKQMGFARIRTEAIDRIIAGVDGKPEAQQKLARVIGKIASPDLEPLQRRLPSVSTTPQTVKKVKKVKKRGKGSP